MRQKYEKETVVYLKLVLLYVCLLSYLFADCLNIGSINTYCYDVYSMHCSFPYCINTFRSYNDI